MTLVDASGQPVAPARQGTWIKTYTGRQVWPLDFQPGDFDIKDIAWALSHLCRYNGHTRAFYSVAEHSFHVANEVARRLSTQEEYSELTPYGRNQVIMQALLHDAAEAYIGDMVRPLKRCAELAAFCRIEDELQSRIYASIGLPEQMHPLIKQVDTELLSIEGELLLGGTQGWSGLAEPPADFTPEIRGAAPHVMVEVFRKFYGRVYEALKRDRIVS